MYWFYGHLWGEKKSMVLVEVWKTSNSFAYVTKGTFMYPEEGRTTGLWTKAIVPELPE
jgi:hypothetical protein